jgi:thiol-disulfide isomerase/thioredoxin
MKEIVHFTTTNSAICDQMKPAIEKLLSQCPDINYTKINVDEDAALFNFYSSKYALPYFPAFLGLVDGKVQDGHLGFASSLILEALVN